MKIHHVVTTCAVFASVMLSSCIWQPIMQNFSRDEYPGPRPAMVIKDVNGKPASNNWKSTPADQLPPSSYIGSKTVSKAEDGTPYGMTSEYSNIILSPYYPHHHLDYTGCKPGDKVWDPYTRKPFYIKRAYTFN